jgi:hypothetical protein
LYGLDADLVGGKMESFIILIYYIDVEKWAKFSFSDNAWFNKSWPSFFVTARRS